MLCFYSKDCWIWNAFKLTTFFWTSWSFLKLKSKKDMFSIDSFSLYNKSLTFDQFSQLIGQLNASSFQKYDLKNYFIEKTNDIQKYQNGHKTLVFYDYSLGFVERNLIRFWIFAIRLFWKCGIDFCESFYREQLLWSKLVFRHDWQNWSKVCLKRRKF